MAEIVEKKTHWFQEGLRFHCTGCGKCCTGSPGYIFLSPDDLEKLSSHCQLSIEQFVDQYTQRVDDQISLIDTPGTDACIFLKNNQCSIYEARPIQCRTFPWWIQILDSKNAWERAAQSCEGINHPNAPLIPALHIEAECGTYLDNLLEQNFSHITDS